MDEDREPTAGQPGIYSGAERDSGRVVVRWASQHLSAAGDGAAVAGVVDSDGCRLGVTTLQTIVGEGGQGDGRVFISCVCCVPGRRTGRHVDSAGRATRLNRGAANYQSIDLTWTAPDDNGGVAPLGYKIEYAEDDNGSPGTYTTYIPNTYSTATSRNVYGLTPGTQYWFRITPYNVHGLSSASAQAAMPNGVVPYTTPGAPTNVTVSTGGQVGWIGVNWNAPGSDGYTPITDYEIQIRDASGPADAWVGTWNTGSNATGRWIWGLGASTSYYARVRTVNAGGVSAWTESASPGTSG